MFFRRSPQQARRSDEELLILYQDSGDLAHLGELYDRHLHLVFGVCMKYLRDKEESKDMTMQIFEKIAVEIKKQEIKNFAAWLHTLSKNECLMLLRSSRYKIDKSTMGISDQQDMEKSLLLHHTEKDELEVDLQHLEKGVESLPPEQKLCIGLFYQQQKSYKEIAEITGHDLNKVKSYIQNGKRNLKLYFQKIDEHP